MVTATVVYLVLRPTGGDGGGATSSPNPWGDWSPPYPGVDAAGLADHREASAEAFAEGFGLFYPRQTEVLARLGQDPGVAHGRQCYPTGIIAPRRLESGGFIWDQVYAAVEAADHGGLVVQLAWLNGRGGFDGYLFPTRPAALLRDAAALISNSLSDRLLLPLSLGMGLLLGMAAVAYMALNDAQAERLLNRRYRETARHWLVLEAAGRPLAAQPPAGVTPQLLAEERRILEQEGILPSRELPSPASPAPDTPASPAPPAPGGRRRGLAAALSRGSAPVPAGRRGRAAPLSQRPAAAPAGRRRPLARPLSHRPATAPVSPAPASPATPLPELRWLPDAELAAALEEHYGLRDLPSGHLAAYRQAEGLGPATQRTWLDMAMDIPDPELPPTSPAPDQPPPSLPFP